MLFLNNNNKIIIVYLNIPYIIYLNGMDLENGHIYGKNKKNKTK